MLGVDNPVDEADVVVTDEFLAPGYGRLNPPTQEAVSLAATSEGLLLDPVYTGKCMAGFLARAKQADSGKTMVFIHTGGTPAIFAYQRELADTPAS